MTELISLQYLQSYILLISSATLATLYTETAKIMSILPIAFASEKQATFGALR